MLRLLFDGDILISFNFFFDRNHLYPFLRDYLFVVLHSFFNCIVILLYNLARDCLDDFALFVLGNFLFYWHAFNIGSVFIFDHLFLIRDVADATLT